MVFNICSNPTTVVFPSPERHRFKRRGQSIFNAANLYEWCSSPWNRTQNGTHTHSHTHTANTINRLSPNALLYSNVFDPSYARSTTLCTRMLWPLVVCVCDVHSFRSLSIPLHSLANGKRSTHVYVHTHTHTPYVRRRFKRFARSFFKVVSDARAHPYTHTRNARTIGTRMLTTALVSSGTHYLWHVCTRECVRQTDLMYTRTRTSW